LLIKNPITINIRPQLPRVINKGLNSISILVKIVKIAKIKTLSLEKVEGFTLVEPEALEP
jgi:hypothetical protein